MKEGNQSLPETEASHRFSKAEMVQSNRLGDSAATAIAPIEVNHLAVSYGSVPALLDVNLRFEAGRLVGIIGPNGSGKSTLIKSIAGFISPNVGNVKIFGKAPIESRNRMAYLPQAKGVDWDFPITVREVALMGCYGRRPWWQNLTTADYQQADRALEQLKMSEFSNRQIGQLSGGQQQRVFLARALAQDADILLLDEPFTGVDASTEEAILAVLQQLKRQGKTIVVVHHDLTTARCYFDLLVLIKQTVFAYAPPDRVLQPNLLAEAYEGNMKVFSRLAEGGEAND